MRTNSIASVHGASRFLTKWGLNNLPLPTSDVQAAPLVAVLINPAWSEVLLSALTVLEEKKTWEDGADTDRAELQTYFLYDAIRAAQPLPTITYPSVQNLFQDGATYPFATPSRTVNNGLTYGYVITVASPANGNYFEHIFPLAAGSYKVSVLGWKQNNAGKIDWTLDGDAVASGQDWYAAASTPNTIQQFTMLNLTKNGLYTLRGTINGKNAASSNYFHYITKITIVPNVGVMP